MSFRVISRHSVFTSKAFEFDALPLAVGFPLNVVINFVILLRLYCCPCLFTLAYQNRTSFYQRIELGLNAPRHPYVITVVKSELIQKRIDFAFIP